MRSAWRELEDYLQGFASGLTERPRAILVISGHWEAARPTVNSAATAPLIYDYDGFPDYTYRLQWPAPGSPVLAAEVRARLAAAGIASASDDQRGWDHGVFVPFKVMFPYADIPIVQLSLQQGLDPTAHIAIGRALTSLRQDGVLIIGSGQTYHNMRGFGGGALETAAEAFDVWLREAMVDPSRREEALVAWEQAPGARAAQPHEDHLLPLMVAAGAASGEPGEVVFHGRVLGKPISGFRFG